MTDFDKWEKGRKLLPEEEADYLKDLCEYLRQQQALSNPRPEEGGGETPNMICEIVPDEIAAHTADIIEELWQRIQNLQYELKEAK